MLKRPFVSITVLLSAFAAIAAAQSVAPDSMPTIGPAKPDLFIRIIANQKRGEAALDLYERMERVETRKNPAEPSPTAIKISRVIPSGTGMCRIPVGADGKPVDSAAYRAGLESLAQALAQLVNDGGHFRIFGAGRMKYCWSRRGQAECVPQTHCFVKSVGFLCSRIWEWVTASSRERRSRLMPTPPHFQRDEAAESCDGQIRVWSSPADHTTPA